MNGWTELDNDEQEEIWSRFYKTFDFKPSTTTFPAFRIPTPFIKFDISNCNADDLIRDFEVKLVKVFQLCTQPGEFIYALDWQHECYKVDPRLEFPRYAPWRDDNRDWIISIYPDGDYHFFLAADFSWGILGHPWENTIAVFGKKFIEGLLINPPLMLHNVLQQG
ncbi:DUF2716 domain-containing protein [Paenibacillus glycanilyticus]|uniref:DUF2716 domain-containing protein n=1 Tax=Paenibacillus glycanilyticus TaxID=126569 RepID=A0ABQ6GAV3_9BACL|nr:DUF2716 domain-containing protein [Paenibacillus glycanilyticus]GLX68023.1 hypothetical protein MU1_23680 [Paenibacillus glycanilyticus]